MLFSPSRMTRLTVWESQLLGRHSYSPEWDTWTLSSTTWTRVMRWWRLSRACYLGPAGVWRHEAAHTPVPWVTPPSWAGDRQRPMVEIPEDVIRGLRRAHRAVDGVRGAHIQINGLLAHNWTFRLCKKVKTFSIFSAYSIVEVISPTSDREVHCVTYMRLSVDLTLVEAGVWYEAVLRTRGQWWQLAVNCDEIITHHDSEGVSGEGWLHRHSDPLIFGEHELPHCQQTRLRGLVIETHPGHLQWHHNIQQFRESEQCFLMLDIKITSYL